MKKLISLLTLLCLSFLVGNSFAYTVPPPPDNGGYIVDQTGKLSSDQINQLNQKLEQINQTTKNEFAALIIPSTNGDDIADIGQSVFRSWGIGKIGLNNGALIVIALAEHQTRIQTGKGIEGDLPDLKCNDILNNTLKPYLRQGDFYSGLDASFEAMAKATDSRAKTTVIVPRSSMDDGGIIIGVCVFFAALIGLITFLVIRSNRKERKRQRQESEDYYNSHYHNDSFIVPPHITPTLSTEAVITAGAIAASEASITTRHEEEKRRDYTDNFDSSSGSSSDNGSSFEGFGGGDTSGGGSSGSW